MLQPQLHHTQLPTKLTKAHSCRLERISADRSLTMVHSNRSRDSLDQTLLLFPDDSVHLAKQHQHKHAQTRPKTSHPKELGDRSRPLSASESDGDNSESSTMAVDSPVKNALNVSSQPSTKATTLSAHKSTRHVHFQENLVTEYHEYEAASSTVDPSRLWYDRNIYQVLLRQARQDVKIIWDFHEAIFANNPESYVNVLQDVYAACECLQEQDEAHELIPRELLDSLNHLYAHEETTLFRVGLETYVLSDPDSGNLRNARRKGLYTTVQELQTSFVWLDEEELELSLAEACANWSLPHRLWATLIGQAQGDAEE